MDQLFGNIFAQWGAVGVVFIIAIYIIVDSIKNKKTSKESDSKLDDIKESLLDVRVEIPAIKSKVEYLENSMHQVNTSLNNKIDDYHTSVTKRVENLENKIDQSPQHIISELDTRAYNLAVRHNKQMIDQIAIAPKIHKVMGDYIDRIGCDHIFLGWFHNGTSSISGVPFYKFDIVAEKFKPKSNPQDYEFGHMYKDVDILRHNKLPIELIQNKKVYYKIDSNNNSELSDVDDILYRRMVGSQIHQIALNLIQDSSEIPVGFVGCICFDLDEINFKELHNCANEINKIYNVY